MSGFAYFNGEKCVENLTMNDIRALAMSGVITETTLIRNPDDQEKEAKFYGLYFSDTLPVVAEFLKGGTGSQTEEESIMQPAIAIIQTLVGLAAVCAVISGFVTIAGLGLVANIQTKELGIALIVGGISTTVSFLFTAMLLAILKYLLLCVDSMEQSFRKIEKNTRKEGENR